MLKRLPIFLGGSALGALVDYVITILISSLYNLDAIFVLGPTMLFSASAVFAFHNRFTFGGTRAPLLNGYVIFLGWSGLIFAVRGVLLEAYLTAGLPLSAALFVAITFASVLNFVISARFIFKKASHE